MSIQEKIKEKLADKIINWHQHSPKRIYISLKPTELKEVAGIFFNDLNLRLVTASGQDTPGGLEILYHFSFDKTGEIFSLRVLIEEKEHPEIESITPIIIGAEWIEREIWEMLGIKFKGHPNLKRLLLAEEWPEGKFPLRHDHES